MDIIGEKGWNQFFQQLKLLNSNNSEATITLQEFNATCEIQHLENFKEIESNKIFPKSEILISNSFKISCSEGNQIFLNFKTFFGDNCFGTLKTEKISLISKPSKSTNLCDETAPLYSRNFKSGDKIAIFHRQKTDTSYLIMGNENCLGIDINQWSVFEIYKGLLKIL
uniref:Uncharacterized protein n=1 Tax=Panagrolaimus davidi TaxID=227884 RepID=A0A914QSS5_9BILA